MKNSNLHKAKAAKNDEFYTRLTDIEKELAHYKEFFRGKVVYCNCDDARESNFFKYFSLNFDHLGLKKLITTGYSENGHGMLYVYEGDKNGNKRVDDEEVVTTELKGNGDFRSEECVEFLKQADVVVTNPPFSLFRDYVKQLMDYGKKFLIIGSMNAITYKEIFPYIKNNQLWLGYGFNGGNAYFIAPNNINYAKGVYDETTGLVKFRNCHWFTNIEHDKRNQPIDLYKKYTPEEYPKYDNYDAIEVSKVADIPMDYDGVMGVPITFIDKYCPIQFEIVGMAKRGAGDPMLKTKVYTKHDYPNYSDLNAGPVIITNGTPKNTYPRILIHKK